MQAAMAMGANMYTEPILEPVKVAQVLVSSANRMMTRRGATLVPRAVAMASPIMAVKPELARASATPMTPAIIRITGANMFSRNSLKSTTFMKSRAMADRPGIT